MTKTETTATETHTTTTENASLGCKRVACSCGWTSAPTNQPQHLNRAARSHRTAVSKKR